MRSAKLVMMTAAQVLVATSISLASMSVHGMTLVPGGAIPNETWTAAASPYLVADDVTIPSGSILKMEAGTTVLIAKKAAFSSTSPTHYGIGLMISGSLVIDGSPTAPVVIEPASDNDTGWAGIYFLAGASGSALQYAEIFLPLTGLYFAADSLPDQNTFSRIQILGAQTGIELGTSGLLTLDGVAIVGVVGSLYGIRSQTYTASLRLSNCIIAKQYNSGSGYVSTAIELHHTAAFSSSITNVTIDNFDIGIAPYSTGGRGPIGPISLVNSIISNSETPIDGTIAVAENDDIWNPGPASPLTLPSYCNNCQSSDPQYAGTTDWHLRAGSPCIDKGTNVGAPNQDADGTPRPLDGLGSGSPLWDVGAYEFSPTGDAGAGGPGLDLSGIGFPDLFSEPSSDLEAGTDIAGTEMAATDMALTGGKNQRGCSCSIGAKGSPPTLLLVTPLLVVISLWIRSRRRNAI